MEFEAITGYEDLRFYVSRLQNAKRFSQILGSLADSMAE